MAKRIHRSGRAGKPNPGSPRQPRPARTPKKNAATPLARRVSHRSVRPGAARPPHASTMPKGARATPDRVQAVRELFWQNVIREILASLVMLSLKVSSTGGATTGADGAERALDGRLGLITANGQRIPIARILPVFSATMGRSPSQITLSAILESTVFQVHTPGGEVYTLPIQEVRGFHALTEQLMTELEKNARAGGGADGEEPFGFAAFTSLSRTRPLADTQDLDETDMAGAD